MAILLSNSGSRKKLRIHNLDISSPKGTFYPNSDSEWENDSFVQQISP
jgi:hypothetical protein